ncbi:hypothetical protein FF125_11420 [Aureibaculum algae]|uniref:Uncharacterized protein n=2 Tax=Aureibaculum TaxID=2706948 RepID=A0A5B7TVA3_9FLAO|nr:MULTISPECIES: hypothetical protein [Aureibaculum]MBJ2174379.1 hypothetical protein [Aureibaculum flavum]QCX39016.1 hypothetical protein FF125_11420 [Aureibaculum algae]
METKVLYLSDLKFNLEIWRRELKFHAKEMDLFEKKLEEIASREFSKKALVPLESFQNKIMIEQDVISKLQHRCKAKIKSIKAADLNEEVDGRLQNDQHNLRNDMRTYTKLHRQLKEEMMDYFLEWL